MLIANHQIWKCIFHTKSMLPCSDISEYKHITGFEAYFKYFAVCILKIICPNIIIIWAAIIIMSQNQSLLQIYKSHTRYNNYNYNNTPLQIIYTPLQIILYATLDIPHSRLYNTPLQIILYATLDIPHSRYIIIPRSRYNYIIPRSIYTPLEIIISRSR